MSDLSDHIFQILDDHQLAGHHIEGFEELGKKLAALFGLVTDPENQPHQFADSTVHDLFVLKQAETLAKYSMSPDRFEHFYEEIEYLKGKVQARKDNP